VTSLAKLRVGARATVLAIDGVDEIACRLMEMGMTPGAPISVLGVAPLGDPLELELRGYRLSVRRSEAESVEVETIAAP
jgi:ferrous iron transport protein A